MLMDKKGVVILKMHLKSHKSHRLSLCELYFRGHVLNTLEILDEAIHHVSSFCHEQEIVDICTEQSQGRCFFSLFDQTPYLGIANTLVEFEGVLSNFPCRCSEFLISE